MSSGTSTSAATVSSSSSSTVSAATSGTIPAMETGSVGSLFSSQPPSFLVQGGSASLSHSMSTKLTASNFLIWKAQVLLVLRASRVVHHVDGTAPPSVESPEFAAYETVDLRILSWLFSCVSDALLPQIIGSNSAVEAWQSLHASFAQGSRPQVRNLVHQLRNMKLNSDLITTYVQKAKGLFDQLTMLGSPMSNEDFCDCIKNGLGEDYEFAIRFLNSNPTQVSFDYLYGLLLNEEIQITQKKSPLVAPSANYANHNGPASRGRGRGRGGSGRGRSTSNGTMMHSSPQPGWGRGTNNHNNSDVANVLCYNCKGRGHYANKYSSPRFPRENPNSNRPMNNFASPSTNQPWVMDTGATHHMTSDLDNLHLYSEYQGPEQVTLEANNGDRIRVVEKNHVVNCEDANPKEVDSSDKTEEVKDNEVTAAAEVVKEEHNQKRHLNVVFIGHVDSGKSTMGGQILLLSGQVDDRTIQKCEKEARDKSRGNGHMAYIMDTNEEERDKGVTIDVGRADFETETVRFTILDAPGHKGFVPNMISGASKADIGVLVISARKGEFETGYERGGQTREHVQLAKTLGVSKLLVAVNKMDDPTVKWSKDRYDAIRSELITFIKSSGYNAKKDVQFLPLSGLVGLNMKERIDKSVCPWWSGPCLLEALDGIGAEIPLRDPKGPFRMPISSKFTDTGAFVTGKVESGSVTKGDALLLMPNKTQVKVLEVYIDENKVKHAEPGENLSIKLSGIDDEEIPKGFVLSSVERPIGAVTEFVAQLQILGPKFISAGYHAVLHIHLAIENCMVVELLHEINPKTKQPMRREIRCAKNGAFVVCRIRVNKLICIEKFSDFPQLGRFTLRYYDETVAVGKVMELPSSGSIF